MRILFALDLREPDLDQRLENAVEWTRRVNGTLDLLYVAPEFGERYVGSDNGALQAEVAAIRLEQQQTLDSLLLRIPEAQRGTAEVQAASRVGEAISEAAAQHGMLLVHTHGRVGLNHFFMGSVAERVVRMSKVPTLVLRVPA